MPKVGPDIRPDPFEALVCFRRRTCSPFPISTITSVLFSINLLFI